MAFFILERSLLDGTLLLDRDFLFMSRLYPERWGEDSEEVELDDEVEDDVEVDELLLEDEGFLRCPCWPCICNKINT